MEKVLLRKLLVSFSWYMYVQLTSPQNEMSPSEEFNCFYGGKGTGFYLRHTDLNLYKYLTNSSIFKKAIFPEHLITAAVVGRQFFAAE